MYSNIILVTRGIEITDDDDLYTRPEDYNTTVRSGLSGYGTRD